MIDKLFEVSEMEMLIAIALLNERPVNYGSFKVPKSLEKEELKTRLLLTAFYKSIIYLLEYEFNVSDFGLAKNMHLYALWHFNDGAFDELTVYLKTNDRSGKHTRRQVLRSEYDDVHASGAQMYASQLDLNDQKCRYIATVLMLAAKAYQDASITPFATINTETNEIKLAYKNKLISRQTEDFFSPYGDDVKPDFAEFLQLLIFDT